MYPSKQIFISKPFPWCKYHHPHSLFITPFFQYPFSTSLSPLFLFLFLFFLLYITTQYSDLKKQKNKSLSSYCNCNNEVKFLTILLSFFLDLFVYQLGLTLSILTDSMSMCNYKMRDDRWEIYLYAEAIRSEREYFCCRICL